ncbi:MAG: phenylalanine--tRNA ligase subunit alpha [Myxococcota bacterium]
MSPHQSSPNEPLHASLRDVDALLAAFRTDLHAASDPAGLDEVRRVHTGKKSALKGALRSLGAVPAEQRAAVAKAINDAAALVEQELADAVAAVEAKALDARLADEWQDLSMPGLAAPRGSRHPITIAENRTMDALRQLGFAVVEGPEVEHPWYNFDALNIPEHHPARDAQDTFWVDGGWLLRSHTTTVQARLLEQRPAPPVKVATYGRVYRNEAVDATHTAMFHQFEGIWVDRGLTFAHLKATLGFVARALYGEGRIRFKPKFYPYTEPSVGVDFACSLCDGAGVRGGGPCEACHGAGWVTILGAGMIHPKVFLTFGYDPAEVSGIAFGFGMSRVAAQRSGVTKSAQLYEQDQRIHEQLFRGGR